MACCIECFNEYSEQISLARLRGANPNLYPERTDMTQDEVVKMIENTPVEVVIEKTINELSDYKAEIEAVGIEQTIAKINNELDSKAHTKQKRK